MFYYCTTKYDHIATIREYGFQALEHASYSSDMINDFIYFSIKISLKHLTNDKESIELLISKCYAERVEVRVDYNKT